MPSTNKRKTRKKGGSASRVAKRPPKPAEADGHREDQPNEFATTCLEQFRYFAENRKDRETKWNRNWTDYRGEFRQMLKSGEGEDWRSRVTSGLCRHKVTTAHAIILDLGLQGGQIPMTIKPSNRLRNEPGFDDSAWNKECEDAQDGVQDDFARCKADRAYANNMLSGALYGETYAKVSDTAFAEPSWDPITPEGMADATQVPPGELMYDYGVQPIYGKCWDYASVWEVFPDPEALHPRDPYSSGIWQQRAVSTRWLRSKKNREGSFFINANIDLAILQAKQAASESEDTDAGSTSAPPYMRGITGSRKRKIIYREGYTWVNREVVQRFETELVNRMKGMGYQNPTPPSLDFSNENDTGEEVYCLVCLAGKQVVRYARISLRDNLWYYMQWDTQLDGKMGRGVADNVEMAHELLTGSLRLLLDNKKLSANIMAAVNRGKLRGRVPDFVPGRVWELKTDATDIDDVWKQIKVDDVGESLMSVIALAERYGDWDTLMAKITQGLQEPQGDRTAYEISQQVERADKYTASILRSGDESLIEPIGTDFFRDRMENPEIRRGKGDFVVQALGFQSYQNRIQRVLAYKELLQLVMVDPQIMRMAKLRGILLPMTKATQIDPDTVWKTQEELDQEDEAMREEMARQMLDQEAAKAQISKTYAEADAITKRADAETLKAQSTAAGTELQAEKQEQEAAARSTGLQLQ